MSDLQTLLSEAEDSGSNQRMIQYMEEFAAQMEGLADWSAGESCSNTDTQPRCEDTTNSGTEENGYQTPANQVKEDLDGRLTVNETGEDLPPLTSPEKQLSTDDPYQEAYGLLGQSSQLNLPDGEQDDSWEGNMLQTHQCVDFTWPTGFKVWT